MKITEYRRQISGLSRGLGHTWIVEGDSVFTCRKCHMKILPTHRFIAYFRSSNTIYRRKSCNQILLRKIQWIMES